MISVACLSKKTEKLIDNEYIEHTYILFPIIIWQITHWITTMFNDASFIFILVYAYCYRKRKILLSIVCECTINCSQSIDAMIRNRIITRWRVYNYWNLFNNNGNVETGNWVDKPGTYPCNRRSHRLFHRYLRSRRTLPCWKQTNISYFSLKMDLFYLLLLKRLKIRDNFFQYIYIEQRLFP